MATHLWYKKKALVAHAAIPGALALSLALWGHDGAWGDGVSAGGAGKVAFPAQTRQGNKIFGIRRDFQITTLKTQVR